MTLTPYTIDDVGGRLPVRSLAHFVQHLPPGSETMRELFPDQAERVRWMRGESTAQLIACLIDELRGMEYLFTKANSKGSVRRPKAFPTPWDEDGERGVTRYGHGAITVAEFEEWFEKEG